MAGSGGGGSDINPIRKNIHFPNMIYFVITINGKELKLNSATY